MQDPNIPAVAAAAAPARRGRPRDPAIEGRIFDAALALYAAQGWAGFNFDATARGAGVSKDAIYRRWRTREALLDETLQRRLAWVEAIDEGSYRADLLALARSTFAIFAGPQGEAVLQLRSDARRFAEVRAFANPYRDRLVQQARAIVRRAIERGETPPDATPTLAMDLLIGAITNHVVSTPHRLRAAMIEQADRFVGDLVDVILIGTEQLAARRGQARGLD